jgi:hypothetical protein
LTDETDDIVENVGVVGVYEVIFMGRGRVELARNILPGEDSNHPGNRHRVVAFDGLDACMGVRRAQAFQMQRALHRNVERVAGLSGDDRFRKGVAQARAARLPRDIRLDIDDAVQRVIDAVVTGAAAEIALQQARQILACLLLLEGRGGHDHAGGAEATLKGLRIEKGLLHRMQLAALREPLDRRDGAPGRPIGRHQTAVERRAVEPDRTGTAIALVAAFLDAEAAVLAQKGAQALARCRFGRDALAVDDKIHIALPGRASSARTCSA